MKTWFCTFIIAISSTMLYTKADDSVKRNMNTTYEKDLEELIKVNTTDLFEIYKQEPGTVLDKDEYCRMTYKSCKNFEAYHIDVKRRYFGRALPKTEICAHKEGSNLTNFNNTCEIGFQNCLYKFKKLIPKAEIKTNGHYYFNGKEKPCKFYLKGKTMEEAINSYYADTLPVSDPKTKERIFSTISTTTEKMTPTPAVDFGKRIRTLKNMLRSGNNLKNEKAVNSLIKLYKN